MKDLHISETTGHRANLTKQLEQSTALLPPTPLYRNQHRRRELHPVRAKRRTTAQARPRNRHREADPRHSGGAASLAARSRSLTPNGIYAARLRGLSYLDTSSTGIGARSVARR